MANERNVKIGIQTTADTSGAEKAVEAIDEVVDKGREAGKAIDDAGKGPGLNPIPREAKAAAGSIDALEEKVRDLTRELNRLPVGSQEFTAMAAKVNAANKEMQQAELVARKLGTTVGRGGNAGGAVLEFSRAFEDAQYGIRGVLNNIPGLIAMLGGGAGLAGIISIAAVAGTQLWERFGGGAKSATKETKGVLDLVKELKTVYQEIAGAGKEDRDASAKDRADGLKAATAGNVRNLKLTLDSTDLDTAKEKAAALLQLAKDKLDLSRVESKLVTATGEDSVRLAKEREVIIKRIYGDELAITEIQRNAATTKATAKVVETFNTTGATTRNAEGLQGEFNALQTTVNALRADSDGLLAERLALVTEIQAATERITALKVELDNPLLAPGAKSRKNLELLNEQAGVGKQQAALGSLDPKIADKLIQGDVAQGQLDELKPELEKATEAQNAAAKAQLDAVEALKNLRTSQAIERKSEVDLKQVADQGVAFQGKANVGTATSDAVGEALTQVLAGIKDAGGNPQVQNLAGQIKALAADGVQGGEQNEVVALFQQLLAKSQASSDANGRLLQQVITVVDLSVSVMSGVPGRLDEFSRKIKDIEAQLKNPIR